MVKHVLAVMVCSVAALSQAQYAGTDPGEARLWQAFDKLRSEDKLYIQVNGTDSLRGDFTTDIYWFWDVSGGEPKAKLQIRQYENGTLTHRIVADGENVYDYDFSTHLYSNTNYGGFAAAHPEKYLSNLMYYVNKLAKGQEVLGARLMREVHNTESASVYRSWMPGINPYMLPAKPTRDPFVDGRYYTDTPSTDFYQYLGPNRAITFELSDDPPSDVYKLSNIYFSELSKSGGKDRLVEWTLTPYTGSSATFDPANFQPYPYSSIVGWRPVVGPTPIKG
jgi:hypothetical protein